MARIFIFLSAVIVLWNNNIQARKPIAKFGDLHLRINKKIKESVIKPEELGIYVSVGDMKMAENVFVLNPAASMIPASLTKVITAGASLYYLKPGTKFKTQLLSSAKVKSHVLQGNLVLKGGGDPGFVSESMWKLVNHFSRNRIHIIEGDIVVDDSHFDAVRYDPSRDDSDPDRAYNAPIGAMSFNWNSINVYIRSGGKIGKKPLVFADPENNYIRIVNQAKTVGGNRPNTIRADRIKKKKGDPFPGDIIKVTGNFPRDAKEKVIYRSITQPDLWSGKHLRAFLERRGIEIVGKVIFGKAPQGAQVLAEVESESVGKMVQDMMKFSNNYVAEMLVKKIAATRVSEPGTMPEGMDKLREYILLSGVKSGIEVYNPSGLTRKNKVTPKAFHEMLISLRGHFDYFSENLVSYPIAGIDGTLKKRMRGTPAEGWVRAKTGLLSGVVGLSGFAGRKNGQVYNFVFLFNGRPELGGSARDLFDSLAVELAR